jgi:hypothetical protein
MLKELIWLFFSWKVITSRLSGEWGRKLPRVSLKRLLESYLVRPGYMVDTLVQVHG